MSSECTVKKVYLIDSMAYIFRAFYAIRSMNAKDGRPTNAVYGFVKSMEKIFKDFDPECIVAVFDAGSKTFRNDIYPEYKANRSECPEELKPQFDIVKEYLKLRGIPLVIQQGFEADDLIGTLAKKAEAEGMEAIICTGDKDMMQLVNEQTVICQTHKDNLVVDTEKVVELTGVRPDQIIDYLAIMGDSSDNVPGLPGIGAKGAAKLLNEYETLENIFANKDKMKGKRVIEATQNHQEQGELSKVLVTIKCDVEIEETFDDLLPKPADFDALEQFYDDLNTNSLKKDVARLRKLAESSGKMSLEDVFASGCECEVTMQSVAAAVHKNEVISLSLKTPDFTYNLFEEFDTEDGFEVLKNLRSAFKNNDFTFNGDSFSFKGKELKKKARQTLNFEYLVATWLFDSELILTQLESHHGAFAMMLHDDIESCDLNKILVDHVQRFETSKVKYTLVNSEEALQDLRAQLQGVKELCLDTETTSLRAVDAELVGIGLSWKAGEAFYVPVNGFIPRETVLAFIKDFVENPALGVFGQNIKYDYEVLKCHGIEIANISFDTLIASYVCNPSRNSHGIDSLSIQYLNYEKIPTVDLIGKGKKQISMADVDVAKVSDYCCEDVDICWQLKQTLATELKDRQLEKLYNEIELPLTTVLGDLELAGIYLDAEMLQAMSSSFEERIESAVATIHELAGEGFNIASPKQLGEILFEKLELPHGKKTKTGYSTDASVLEDLAQEHEIAQEILEYRMLTKLKSTYVDALPQEISEKTGRIHASFNQSTAQTGRLSCTNPNLQNIPTRTEEGKKIRTAFKAKEGHQFLACDYSQIELRVMAHICEDPALLEAFNNDFDIHTYTASLVNGCEMDAVTKQMRYNAKAINFGIIYGQGAFGLAKELGVSAQTAKLFIKNYFMRYPKVRDFMASAVDVVREKGYAETAFERRRYIPEINHSNGRQRSFAERIAVNTPIQGTAADIIKKAMIELSQQIKAKNLQSKMILQIHDELVFEVPDSELEIMQELVPQIMSEVVELKVPLKVDLAVSSDWSSLD